VRPCLLASTSRTIKNRQNERGARPADSEGVRFATRLGRDIQLSRLESPTSIRQSRLPRSSLVSNARSKTISPVLCHRFAPQFPNCRIVACVVTIGRTPSSGRAPRNSKTNPRIACVVASPGRTSRSPVNATSRRNLADVPFRLHTSMHACIDSTPLCAVAFRCQATFLTPNILWLIATNLCAEFVESATCTATPSTGNHQPRMLQTTISQRETNVA
jgi:hypothetical protein